MARNLRVGVQRGLRQSIGGGLGTGDIFTLSPASFDFSRTNTKDSRITFTRASSGTFVGADGLIKSAATNTPRFDHDPVTSKSLGLLIEEARTNLFLRSEKLNEWIVGNGSSVTANQAVAPDGTTTADQVQHGSGGSSWIRQDVLTSGTTYTASVYAKAVTPGTNDQFTFDLGGLSSVFVATGEWKRFIFTGTASNASIYLNNGDDSFATDVYFWGAQVEEGSFATSYIATDSSNATRAADVVEITGTNFSSFYSEAKGSVFVQASGATLTGNPLSLEIHDGTTDNRHTLDYGSGDITTVVGGTSQSVLATGAPSSAEDVVKVAFAYGANNFAASKDGGSIVSDTSGTVPTTSEMQLGNDSAGTKPLNGHIKRLIYFPMRLADATLQSITS